MGLNTFLCGFSICFVAVVVADVLFGLVNYLLKRRMLKKAKAKNSNVKKITYKG